MDWAKLVEIIFGALPSLLKAIMELVSGLKGHEKPLMLAAGSDKASLADATSSEGAVAFIEQLEAGLMKAKEKLKAQVPQ